MIEYNGEEKIQISYSCEGTQIQPNKVDRKLVFGMEQTTVGIIIKTMLFV